ncbi:hypothetical protein ACET3Z_000126 [Daucus carota]
MPIITPAYPCMNSGYNVSTSTLRVMREQFQFGNKICEEIELNKSQWKDLFEPCMFFKSYKNYLQIVRDTCGKLQCHPCPYSSKQSSHCAFFTGLQRKEGDVIQQDGYKPGRALRQQQRKQSSHIDHGCSSGSASAGRQLNKEFYEANVQGSVE